MNFTKTTEQASKYYLFFLIIFLFSCNKNEGKFIYKWKSIKTIIPHKEYLEINSDHTFSFNGGACTSSYLSFGKWEIINDTLILNSSKSKECKYIIDFEPSINKNFIQKTTIDGCIPKNQDFYVNFINNKFYIENDTLIFISKNKLPFKNPIVFFHR